VRGITKVSKAKIVKRVKSETEKPLKNVYKTLYGKQDIKIISDKRLNSFKWRFVPLKDK
jgi:hypothetical protein